MHETVETGPCASGLVNARSVARTSVCGYFVVVVVVVNLCLAIYIIGVLYLQQQQQQRTTRIYWSALLIVRSRGQRRKGQSRLSCARAEERPGRMRHGRWGRAHGWASVPPTASQSIAASSVDAAWGSGHHHETRMRGTKGLPPPRTTNCHAVACDPRRRRATCACHTRD